MNIVVTTRTINTTKIIIVTMTGAAVPEGIDSDSEVGFEAMFIVTVMFCVPKSLIVLHVKIKLSSSRTMIVSSSTCSVSFLNTFPLLSTHSITLIARSVVQLRVREDPIERDNPCPMTCIPASVSL